MYCSHFCTNSTCSMQNNCTNIGIISLKSYISCGQAHTLNQTVLFIIFCFLILVDSNYKVGFPFKASEMSRSTEKLESITATGNTNKGNSLYQKIILSFHCTVKQRNYIWNFFPMVSVRLEIDALILFSHPKSKVYLLAPHSYGQHAPAFW